MTSRTAFPPSYHHATKTVTPDAARDRLAAFLAKTPTTAYLHPDAILSQNGIQYPAQSGPQGGLALHHLRRIQAGLGGENLIAESKEDLKALFAPETEPELPAGDDARLNTLIGITKRGKRARSVERVEQWRNGEDAVNPEEYANQQEEIEEEFGNDTLSGQGEQRNGVPEINTTGKVDKAARKAAKKAKKLQEKREAAQKAAG